MRSSKDLVYVLVVASVVAKALSRVDETFFGQILLGHLLSLSRPAGITSFCTVIVRFQC